MLFWLLEGDPAIRWQVQRDLLGTAPKVWEKARSKTALEGWGSRFLAEQDPDGKWGGGFYSPKWISTTYTLLNLCWIGVPPKNLQARTGAEVLLDGMLGKEVDETFLKKLVSMDRCIVGMIFRIAVYFQIKDVRVDAIMQNLLEEQMPDGGWNCRRHKKPEPHHSSFHTTLNVLEGVREYIEIGKGKYLSDAKRVESEALELLLEHKLFRSDKTGNIINTSFTQFPFPHYWYYDALRALCYFERANHPRDERLEEATELLKSRQLEDGKWKQGKPHSAKVFFNMETIAPPSRWNTLRALRVLKWWE